jgi:uncharacterized membrane protein YecN with MAPEG domain
MPLTLTAIYTVALVPVFLIVWINVTKTRAQMGVSIGNNDNIALHEKIRRHGNFIEWVPLLLILMALAEMRGGNTAALHLAGVLLVAGRVLHPVGLQAGHAGAPLRIIGSSAALLALLVLTVLIVLSLL